MTLNVKLRKWTWLVLVILLLSTAGVSFAAPNLVNSLSAGRGYDPLNNAEQQRALTAALNSRGAGASTVRSEILLVERHQETKDVYRQGVWARRADVYIYDYNTDSLDYFVVNNDNNQVEEHQTLKNVQLPPTENEIQIAVNRVFADAQLFTELKAWFTKLTGQELTTFDQIAAKAFIFHADSMGTAEVGEAKSCGHHRCVQLLIYTKDMIAFDKSPVVNLSTDKLATVLHPRQ